MPRTYGDLSNENLDLITPEYERNPGPANSVGNSDGVVGKSGNLHCMGTRKLLKTWSGREVALDQTHFGSLQTGGLLKCRRVIGFSG